MPMGEAHGVMLWELNVLKGKLKSSPESNLLPGTAAVCSPCSTRQAVPAAQAACSSHAASAGFFYKMHYLPV